MFKYTAEKLFKYILCFLLILSIGIICSGCKNNITITSDFDTYLKSDSTFNKNIKGVLPSQEELKNAKIVFYMLYDDNDTEEAFAESMIRLTVKYSADDFEKAKNKMEQLSGGNTHSSFYYDGVLYKGAIYYNDGYYAIAYSACSDAQTVSYIALNTFNLAFMDVPSALELFPDFECKRQIVSQ